MIIATISYYDHCYPLETKEMEFDSIDTLWKYVAKHNQHPFHKAEIKKYYLRKEPAIEQST
jgi:hypothetical protein